ncbi:MAG: transcriptional regulator [Sphingomonas sp.]
MSDGAPDELIHQSTRLKLMAALEANPEPLDFSRLKAISGATDGNLGAHLGTLEGAGYVAVDKQAIGKRTRSLVAITPSGRAAFHRHLAYLRAIIDSASLS